MNDKLYLAYEYSGYGMRVMFISTSVEDAIKLVLDYYNDPEQLYETTNIGDQIRLKFYKWVKYPSGVYRTFADAYIFIKPVELSQFIGIGIGTEE